MTEASARILAIKTGYDDISHSLDERRIRLWCAAKARAYDRIYKRGGVTAVHKATGVSRPRIYSGLKDIESDDKLAVYRVRRKGGGRKTVTEEQPTLLDALDALVDPESRGDPESPLRWTCKSTSALRDELVSEGYRIGTAKVGHLLSDLDCSLQSNRKTKEGCNHPDRDLQFRHINDTVISFQARGLR